MLSRLQQNVLLSSIPPQLLVTRRLSRSHLPFVFREDIKEAAADWGLECLRYEIKAINVPAGINGAAGWGFHCTDSTTAPRICSLGAACMGLLVRHVVQGCLCMHVVARTRVCRRCACQGYVCLATPVWLQCALGYWSMHLLAA